MTYVTIGTSGEVLTYSDYDNQSHIIIANGVTSIADSCFYGASSLTSITIPDSVTSLEWGCFEGCTSLTSITIPDSVINLGTYCFIGCTSLTSITIGNSVISLGNACFRECTSLTSITIPDSVTSLGGACFSYCTSLTSITIGNGSISMSTNSFFNCINLKFVTHYNIRYEYIGINSQIGENVKNLVENNVSTAWLSPLTLDIFRITPTNITVENSPATINMTFSDNRITLTDISNSLTVDPSNAGIISNITGSGTDWTADFTPNYGLDLTDCSLKFKHDGYGIDTSSNTFTIETYIQQIKSVILTPENIITDLSSNLEVILRVPTGTTEPTITIDPSYIAYLDGNMTSSDGGFTWNGSINRTPGMNLLGNTLTVSIGDISSNIAFDVVEQDIYINSSNELIRFVKPIADVSNIEYPNTTSNFQINFTTNDKTFDDISGNVSLTSSVSNIDTSSLALTHYGFRLEGNIVADPYSENDINKLTYYETVDISGESANFTINTNPDFELLGCTLTPENLVDTDVSATLRIEFNTPITGSSPNFNFTLDPSYIATMGTMSDVSSGFVWEGVLTRTPNMNKLGNKLDFDFSYNGVEVSANLVFDVVENSELINKKWSLSNSDTINNVFTSTLQMSPNGLLMGFIDGSNVEIYRKSESSYTWNHDVSYNGHTFALTNNHIVLANNEFLQINQFRWNICSNIQ
jgi:hypothetical protein